VAIEALASLNPPLNKKFLKAIAFSLAETFPPKRQQRIFFDISSVVVEDDLTGIQRVARAIVQELAGHNFLGRDLMAVYSLPGEYGFREANHYMREILGLEKVKSDGGVDFVSGDILVFLDLHPGVAIGQQEYLMYLRRKGVKVIYVVYDLIPVIRPEFFWPGLCKEFQTWLHAVCNSDGALCISNAVADDLRTFIASNEIVSDPFFHIGFFHLGADLENSIPSRGIPVGGQELLDRLASQKTFLMVGTIEPRKGHEQVLAAFENCWNIGIDATLVIVGKQGWKMEAFIDHLNKHVENGRGLLYLKQISDEFLNELYNTCSCLVAASECEGFGLPLIEAAKHKLPIIARDIPVFREVAGEHAYYFSADEPEQLAQAIQSWLDLYKNKAHPKSDSMPWLTWKQSSQQLLAAIELTVKDSQTQIGIN
jgi:glycosyltransferase involved in cell wall biosynthesis